MSEKTVEKYNNAEKEAKRLGVPTAWVWKKAREGKLPCAKVGKYYFFDPQETDKWMKNQGNL